MGDDSLSHSHPPPDTTQAHLGVLAFQGIMTGTSTPLMVLQKLGGWETIQMVQRYAHLHPGYLADYAGNGKILTSQEPENENQASSVELVA